MNVSIPACPECGTPLRQNARRCHRCGAVLNLQARRWIVWALGAVILVALVWTNVDW